MFYKLIENVISKEECNLFIESGLKTDLQIMRSSKIVNGKVVDEDVVKLDDNKRKGSYFLDEDLKTELFTQLSSKIISILNSEKIFNGIEYYGVNKYTFNKYEAGDFLNWHSDTHEIINGATTTIIIQLNDNYKGGDILYKINQTEYSVPKKEGSLFIFDSNIEHNISPILDGVRYSMNVWPSSSQIKSIL